MSRNQAVSFLLMLALPIWGFGLYQSMKVRKTLTERACHTSDVFVRYEALGVHLGKSSRILYIADPGQNVRQFFRAQYALAPNVLSYIRWRNLMCIFENQMCVSKNRTTSNTQSPRFDESTLILDFKEDFILEETLAWISSEAETRGLAVSKLKVDTRLFLVSIRG